MKNNTLKQKAKYRAAEAMASPINTSESCAGCQCGEAAANLAEFAEEHSPAKTITKKRN